MMCFGGSIRRRDTNRLDRLIRRAGSVVGMELQSVVADTRQPHLGGVVGGGVTTALWTMCRTVNDFY